MTCIMLTVVNARVIVWNCSPLQSHYRWPWLEIHYPKTHQKQSLWWFM